MKRLTSKKELDNEIAHLEEKALHSKAFGDDKNYPKSSRARFLKKYNEYRAEIRELKGQLRVLDKKGEFRVVKEFLGVKSKDLDSTNEDLGTASDSGETEFLGGNYIELDEEDIDSGDDMREEIDFSDSRKALNVFNTLYPEGLDD